MALLKRKLATHFMNTLVVDSLQKSFGRSLVLENISFTVNRGEFVSVLGASGCGKTTLLRLIAGLEKPDYGKIYIDGMDQTYASASKRNIGMVFQSYSLFPNMTVWKNITYPMTYKQKQQNDTWHQRLDEIIEKCELESFLYKFPYQLSGGQQQRAALARSLIALPKILLLDEPFSALDASLRQNLRKLVKRIQDNFEVAIVYVTHDQEDAFTLSDKIIIMNECAIQQIGQPREVYESPQNLYVTRFICEQLKERYKNLARIVHPAKMISN